MTEPMDHIDRVAVVKDYAERYGIRSFIETGTAEGFMVSYVLDTFDMITTIELSEQLYLNAKERFQPWPNVSCVHGDSAEWLPKLVPMYEFPILFWLDGHYSGGNTARGEIDTPIRAELEAAIKAPKGSVILIDDMRLFGGMEDHTIEFKDYPHVDWIRQFVWFYDFDFTVKDDIGRCTPR